MGAAHLVNALPDAEVFAELVSAQITQPRLQIVLDPKINARLPPMNLFWLSPPLLGYRWGTERALIMDNLRIQRSLKRTGLLQLCLRLQSCLSLM